MENIVKIPVDEVVKDLDVNSVNRYEKVSQDVIVRLKNDVLTVKIIKSNSFGDYLMKFLFFILYMLVIIIILYYCFLA